MSKDDVKAKISELRNAMPNVLHHMEQDFGFVREKFSKSHLKAIKGVVSRSHQASLAIGLNYTELTKVARDDPWTEDAFFDSAFQDAAHDLVVSGLLTSFLESHVVAALGSLERFGVTERDSTLAEKRREILNDQGRAGKPNIAGIDESADPFWNVKLFCEVKGKEKGLVKDDWVRGSGQVAKIVGLDKVPLPNHPSIKSFEWSKFNRAISALQFYRNSILHNGFEWPEGRKKSFLSACKEGKWSSWFDLSWKGEAERTPSNLWMVHLTHEFAEEIYLQIDLFSHAFAQFLYQERLARVPKRK